MRGSTCLVSAPSSASNNGLVRPADAPSRAWPSWSRTLEYGLSVYKVHFGNLTLKAYTKSERVLRFEAVCTTPAISVAAAWSSVSQISSRGLKPCWSVS